MRVALAMVVRDEVDIVEQHLRFHLAVGVDVVLATDHGSQDGTREILDAYASRGTVRVFDGEGPLNRQGEWMTRMAHVAATELGIDWMLCSDGDEFWWPAGGSLPDLLAAVPERYGVVHVLSQSFVPRPDDDRLFPERMTLRLSPPAPVSDPVSPYRPVSKVAHRARPDARVSNGNHEVLGVPGAVLRGFVPLDILHFPLRSSAQLARKYRKTWEGWEANPRGDLARARQLAADERLASMYRRVVVDGSAAARGLHEGTLVCDTRLRDALRTLGDGATPEEGSWRTARNERHALEAAVLAEAELVRLQRHVESLRVAVDRLRRNAANGRRAPRRARRVRRR